MSSRRQFLAAPGAIAASLPALAQSPGAAPVLQQEISIEGAWRFRLNEGVSWSQVNVPHTWNTAAGSAEHYGVAWYEREFDAPQEWAAGWVRIEFEAVYHSAAVWVNDRPAGEHLRKGYTAFTLDLTPHLRFGGRNVIRVRVDNSFDDRSLPRGRSSDWAHDGGIYRPVRLLITPRVFIERVEIDAEPDAAYRRGFAGARVHLRNAGASAAAGRVTARVEDASGGAAYSLAAGERGVVAIAPVTLHPVRLWHFDHPNLYRMDVRTGDGAHWSGTFGVRKIEIVGTGFRLNGEPVRLMGVERMAGSNPLYGMAEPEEWIAHDHADMRALNCVYTRVHWPQDRRVLDWCDRHGMLIQTEVPAWGPKTFDGMKDAPSDAILQNGLEQLREMIARDRNHPCIFSWGVCNETNGQNPPAYQFSLRLYDEAKRLDPKRLVTYASHSLFKTPEKDVAGRMDYLMFNEYVGSWQEGGPADLERIVDQLHAAYPDKPVVISEYGYCACTPQRPEGDRERIGILKVHDRIFRERDWIAGLIFFCYNDYRTHIGDKGVGVLKQRVHGVVDVFGARKLSWAELRAESSPATLERRGGEAVVTARPSVPSYALRGYRVRAVAYGVGDIPLEQEEFVLADLKPGASAAVAVKLTGKVKVALLRPDGVAAAEIEW